MTQAGQNSQTQADNFGFLVFIVDMPNPKEQKVLIVIMLWLIDIIEIVKTGL